MGSEWEASDHTGGWAVDGDPTGKDVRLSLQGMRGHEPLARHRTKRCQDEGRQAVVGAHGRARAGQR